MHSDNFSQVRGYLLAHSKVILQDDSGIPYRFFSKDKWNLRFYGHYPGPIRRFLKNAQPDLARERRQRSAALALQFWLSVATQPLILDGRDAEVVAKPS